MITATDGMKITSIDSTTVSIYKAANELAIDEAPASIISAKKHFEETEQSYYSAIRAPIGKVVSKENVIDIIVAYVRSIAPNVFDTINQNKLEKLSLSFMGLEDADAIELARALRKNSSIKEIYLNHNFIGDQGANALAAALVENASVTTLILFQNNMGNEATKAIAYMFNNRKTPFKFCIFGENPFDRECAVPIMHALQKFHPDVPKNVIDNLVSGLWDDFSEYPTLTGLSGIALSKALSENPNKFLQSINSTFEDVSVNVLGAYDLLSECHCISLFSRDAEVDCRKMVENLLVKYYTNLELSEQTFRYASLSASSFFPDVINIAKLVQARKKGQPIQVDLIDDYKYGDHNLIVKNICQVPDVFQFLALLHRMGIEVRQTDNPYHKPLLIERYGFALFKHIFKTPPENHISVLTLSLYDSVDSYQKFLIASNTSPHAVLNIDAGMKSDIVKGLKNKLKDGTAYFQLSKGLAEDIETSANESKKKTEAETTNAETKKEYDVRLKAEVKQNGTWIETQKMLTFAINYEFEEKRRKEKLMTLTAKKGKDEDSYDPFLEVSIDKRSVYSI